MDIEEDLVNYLGVKQIGIIIIMLSLIFFLIVFSFNLEQQKLYSVLHKECPLPPEICPYGKTLSTQSLIGFVISVMGVIFGIYLVLKSNKIEKRNLKRDKRLDKVIKSLKGSEKEIYKIIKDSDDFVLQSKLIEKTGLSKVKVTRELDKLEAKGLIERKRRGMSNIVLLKNESG